MLGYDVIIRYSNQDAGLEADEIDHLLACKMDGLILVSTRQVGSSSVFERMQARKVPYVIVDSPCTSTDQCYVEVEDNAIGRLATSHLLECGCRRIA